MDRRRDEFRVVWLPVIIIVLVGLALVFSSTRGCCDEIRLQFYFEDTRYKERTKTAAIDFLGRTENNEVRFDYQYPDTYSHFIKRTIPIGPIHLYATEHRQHIQKQDIQDYSAGGGFKFFKKCRFDFGLSKQEGRPIRSEWNVSYHGKRIELESQVWIRNYLEWKFEAQIHPLKNVAMYYKIEDRNSRPWTSWGLRAETRLTR